MAPQEKTARGGLFGGKEGKTSGNIKQAADKQIRITRSKAKTDTTGTDSRKSLHSVHHLLFLLKQRPEALPHVSEAWRRLMRTP